MRCFPCVKPAFLGAQFLQFLQFLLHLRQPQQLQSPQRVLCCVTAQPSPAQPSRAGWLYRNDSLNDTLAGITASNGALSRAE